MVSVTGKPGKLGNGSIVKKWIVNERGERVLLKGSRYGIMKTVAKD